MQTSIAGIVRFSVLSTRPSPFQLDEGRNFAERAAIIMDEERLRHRFGLFENIVLSSFDAQTDPDFLLFIVTARQLPRHWRERLEQLAAEHAYLRILTADETDFHIAQVSPQVLAAIDTSRPFCTFRWDDDDGAAMTFIERLRRHTHPGVEGLGVSLCLTTYAEMRRGAVKLKPMLRPNIGAGLALIGDPRAPKTIFDISQYHPKLHQRIPVITDAGRQAALVTAHDWNDTGQGRHADGPPLPPAVAGRKLREAGFAVRLEAYMGAAVSARYDAEIATGLATLQRPLAPERERENLATLAERRRVRRDRFKVWLPANWPHYARYVREHIGPSR